MDWHFIGLIAPAAYATCNYLDKYLLTKYFGNRDSAILLIVSGSVASIVALLVLLCGTDILHAPTATRIALLISGALMLLSFFPYFKALQQEETSRVIPIFQSIPVFNYIFARIFLDERLSPLQILAGLIVIVGAIGISIEFGDRRRLKLRPLLLMLLSSLIYGCVNTIWKKYVIDIDYWTAIFWQYLGTGLVSFLMFAFSRTWRLGYIDLIRNARITLAFAAFQEVAYIVGALLVSYALLFAPIALVSVFANGLQPFYVFVFGFILTKLLPSFFNEKFGRSELIQKLGFSAIIFAGIVTLAIADIKSGRDVVHPQRSPRLGPIILPKDQNSRPEKVATNANTSGQLFLLDGEEFIAVKG